MLHYDQLIPIINHIKILTMVHFETHSLERILFIIPIAYVGYVFGLRAGIIVLVIVYLGILPRVFYLSEDPLDEFWEATLSMGVALVFNLWLETRRRELSQQKHLIKERTAKLAEKQKAQRALSRLASIVNSTDDAIIGFGLDGLISSINDGAEKLFHCTERGRLGKHISCIMPGYTEERLRQILAVIKRGGHEHGIENVNIAQKVLDLSVTVSPVKDEKGAIASASLIAKDITEQKNLEREILEISKREQEKLGQLLHDSLGQQLTGIAFKCKVLEKKLAGQKIEHVSEPREIAMLINQAINQTRSLSKGLLHFELEAIGLVNALSEIASNTENLYGLDVVFRYDGRTIINDNTTAVQLYRITQEAVTNAVRHGNPTEIGIELKTEARNVCLSISDNGSGTPAAIDRHRGLGIRIMNYRSDIIGARLEIIANTGSGIIVQCILPAAL
jgi:two-component system sensor kinase FixL